MIEICTIGAKKINRYFYLFKTRDPVPGWVWEDSVKKFEDDVNKLIVCNDDGMYGGINELGVGMTGTYVKVKEGQGAYFDDEYMRKVLDAKSAKESMEFIKNFRPFMEGNLIITDKEKCFALEVGPNRIEVIEVKYNIVMTNHFHKLPYQSIKYDDSIFHKWTHTRFDRAIELLEKTNSRKDLEKLLSDHKNGKFSICNHDNYNTSSGFIVDPKNTTLWSCRGKPCENEFEPFSF